MRPLGSSIDDAAGEADGVARVLGLPFPGGPHVDRAAREGNAVAIDFPRGLTSGRDMERHRFDFSFSGLKTSVARWVEARERSGEAVPVADVAASFQEAVVDVLTRKAVLACRENGVENLQIGGGVAANSRLRAMAQERCDAAGITLRVPRPGLCTDNGAMVAALGAQMVLKGRAPRTSRSRRLLDARDGRTGLTVPSTGALVPVCGSSAQPPAAHRSAAGGEAEAHLEGHDPGGGRPELGGERRARARAGRECRDHRAGLPDSAVRTMSPPAATKRVARSPTGTAETDRAAPRRH